jgi:hypothetical protein
MQDATISNILVKLLETRLQRKKAELEVLSQPVFSCGQRMFQAEVEHQQLHGLLRTARSLVEGMSTL